MREVLIRRERSDDEPGISRVNEEAFGGPDEARLVEAIRRAGHPAISLVAVEGDRIVGHVLFTPVRLRLDGSSDVSGHASAASGGRGSGLARRLGPIAGLGPMSVVPGRQRAGIGSLLVATGLRVCAGDGVEAVVVVGHPEFYRKFGFRPAREFILRCEFDVPDDVSWRWSCALVR